ncbi:MAG: class I SAM-dependent methyltransferase [Rhodobiaceae bacterium]|nr:class I SAM-dependent methyltransferase [Rhodobiaceae bacterium]
MASTAQHDSWSAGRSYDHYMGRWSRLIAHEFLDGLNAPGNADWADIGCGTGALTRTILDTRNPRSVTAVDMSEGFVDHARSEIPDPRAEFRVGDAQALPLADDSVDIATSALVLNFVPDMPKALGEMRRIARDGGMLSFYVWDYPGGGIGFIDAFWSAAAAVDPAARALNEADRFPFCTPEGLAGICEQAGLADASIRPIEVPTVFADFEAFWHPFTLGAGPAPGYCMSLPDEQRNRLKDELRKVVGGDGEIRLPARAWAVVARP